MSHRINFTKRQTKFLGRNGYFKCHGVGLMLSTVPGSSGAYQSDIFLTPITSRKTIGRAEIWIPKEHFTEFVEELKKYL